MRQYTAQDADAFTKAEEQLSKNGLDKWTQEGMQRNADLIDQFFQANPTLPVTLQNIYRAVETRKSEFAWLSQAQINWYETAQNTPELANQLASFLAGQKRLVSNGDQLFENLVLLFNEINAHPQPIAHAEDRIAHRPGKKLHYVQAPRKEMGTITEAARNDDHSPFLGSDLVKNADGSYRTKSPAEQRRDMEAAENLKSQAQTTTSLSASDQQWNSMALDALNDGRNHAERDQLKRVYDQRVGVGASPREIYEAVNQTRNALKRQREQMPA